MNRLLPAIVTVSKTSNIFVLVYTINYFNLLQYTKMQLKLPKYTKCRTYLYFL